MKVAPTIETEFEYRRPMPARALWVLVNAIRLPIAGILLLLEPIVGFLCGSGLVLGVLASVLFEMSAASSRFPLAKVLGISLSFGVFLFLYYGLVSIFIKD
jgi:hypothetical protein